MKNSKDRGRWLGMIVSVLFLIAPFGVIIADRLYEQKFLADKVLDERKNLARNFLDEIRFSCTFHFQIRELLLQFHKELEPAMELPEKERNAFIARIHEKNCPALPKHDLYVALKTDDSREGSLTLNEIFRCSSGTGLSEKAIPAFSGLMDDQNLSRERIASAAGILGKAIGFPLNSRAVKSTQRDACNRREACAQIFNMAEGEKGLYWYYPKKDVKKRFLVCMLLDLREFDPNFGIKRILREYRDETPAVAFLPENPNSEILSSSFFFRDPLWSDYLKTLSKEPGVTGFEGNFRGNFFCTAPIPGGLPYRVLVAIPASSEYGTNFLDVLFFTIISVLFLFCLGLVVEKNLLDRGPRVRIAMVLMMAFFTVSFVPISLAKIMIRIGLSEKNKTQVLHATEELRERLERFDKGFELPGAEYVHRIRESGRKPELKEIFENEKPQEKIALKSLYESSNPDPETDLHQMLILSIAGEKKYQKSATRFSGYGQKNTTPTPEQIQSSALMSTLVAPFLNKFLMMWNPELFKPANGRAAGGGAADGEAPDGVTESGGFDSDSLKNEMKSDFTVELLRGILGLEGYYRFISNVEAVGMAKTSYSQVFIITTRIIISGVLKYMAFWVWSDFEMQEIYIPREIEKFKADPENSEIFLARKSESQEQFYQSCSSTPEAIWKLIDRTRSVDLPQGSGELANSEKIILEAIPGKHLNLYILGGSKSIAPIIEEQRINQTRFQAFVFASILIALFIAWLVNLYFLTPLGRLRQAIDKIENKNFEERLDQEREDEFGTIGTAYNVMAKGLREGTLLRQYVSSSVQRIVGDKEAYQKAIIGEKREVTVVFSSLHGFEKIRSGETPQKAMQLLGKHLRICSASIRKFGGDIDKVIGEKVMMFFDHKDLGGSHEALRAAILVAGDIRDGLKLESLEPAIGINSGEVIAGIVGAQSVRLDYTVIGDAVNLAARLAAMAHDVQGSRVILSGTSRTHAPEKLNFEKLANRTVKGKTQEIEAFLLL